MPGFDGTGPRGLGPMTGRGEGYCALAIDSEGEEPTVRGYTGLHGYPMTAAAARVALAALNRLCPPLYERIAPVVLDPNRWFWRVPGGRGWRGPWARRW
jgi:hypothetical protein